MHLLGGNAVITYIDKTLYVGFEIVGEYAYGILQLRIITNR